MNTLDRREILSRVAAGTISPADAAAQLDGIDEPEEEAQAIRRLRVVRQLGNAEIVGDTSVRDAVADGPHRARIEGDLMIIEGEGLDEPGSFMFGLHRHFGSDRMVIRVNPTLPLELHLQGGSCRVRGVEGPIRADVQAGSATIHGFIKPLDLSVQAGSVRAVGRLDDGDSRISCDAGSVNLDLERRSSVRITARAHLGKVSLPTAAGARGAQAVTVGAGTGSLSIETSMGSVRVTADW